MPRAEATVVRSFVMPRAELRRHTVVVLSVSHYAEGGATEAYCSRAVCPSVCYKHFSPLAEN